MFVLVSITVVPASGILDASDARLIRDAVDILLDRETAEMHATLYHGGALILSDDSSIKDVRAAKLTVRVPAHRPNEYVASAIIAWLTHRCS